jgi:hypothetical protein
MSSLALSRFRVTKLSRLGCYTTDNNKGDYEKQAYDYSGFNFWNNSNRGNYWNDWISPDNDNNGIVDVPYQLSGDAAAKDFFPLTKPIIIDI